MDVFQTIAAARVIYALAIVIIVSALLVFFSCRCLPGSRIARTWMQNSKYQRFYKGHCYYWWVLWISLIVHAVFAVGFLGNPFMT
jgi:hypothetical protein